MVHLLIFNIHYVFCVLLWIKIVIYELYKLLDCVFNLHLASQFFTIKFFFESSEL